MKARSRLKIQFGLLLSLLQIATAATMGQSAEAFKFSRSTVGLTDDQMSEIRNGKPISRYLHLRNF